MKNVWCCLFLLAGSAFAADLTGKWSGSFDITNANGDTKAATAYMDLKENAGSVTGTAGPNAEEQMPIQKGKLQEQKLTFEVVMEDGGVLTFELTFDGDAITGNARGKRPNGDQMTAKLNLKRAT